MAQETEAVDVNQEVANFIVKVLRTEEIQNSPEIIEAISGLYRTLMLS